MLVCISSIFNCKQRHLLQILGQQRGKPALDMDCRALFFIADSNFSSISSTLTRKQSFYRCYLKLERIYCSTQLRRAVTQQSAELTEMNNHTILKISKQASLRIRCGSMLQRWNILLTYKISRIIYRFDQDNHCTQDFARG